MGKFNFISTEIPGVVIVEPGRAQDAGTWTPGAAFTASVAPGSSPQPQTTAAAGTGTSGDLFTTAAKPAMEKSATAPGPQQELQPNAEFTVSGRISSPIARIVIFYEDRSFESYTPEKPLK